MSRYLIDRIEATPNIEVLTRTEIVALIGRPGAYLERVRWRCTSQSCSVTPSAAWDPFSAAVR